MSKVWLRNASWGFVCWCVAAAVAACDSEDSDAEIAYPATTLYCRTESDCIPALTCVYEPTAVADAPTHVQAGPVFVCDRFCPDIECEPGFHCDTAPAPVCVDCYPGCASRDCQPGNLCQSDSCQPVEPCTSPDFPGCPEYWRCDVEAAAALFALDATRLSVAHFETRGVPLAAGCVPMTCEDEGGPTCDSEYWHCDPDGLGAVEIGCAPIPCEELGYCPGPGRICREATLFEQAYNQVDMFGCVPPTCEEGFECPANQVCDVANGSLNGCRPLDCTEPGGPVCTADETCTRDQPGAWLYCKPNSCTENYDCGPNKICSPTMDFADRHGCVSNGTSGVMGGSACSTDYQCPRYCVMGTCSSELGRCR